MSMLFFTVLFPLAGFLLLAFGRDRWSENVAAGIGVGALGMSALTSLLVGVRFMASGGAGDASPPAFEQLLWTWLSVDGFAPAISLRLDGLSLTMLGVIVEIKLKA